MGGFVRTIRTPPAYALKMYIYVALSALNYHQNVTAKLERDIVKQLKERVEHYYVSFATFYKTFST